MLPPLQRGKACLRPRLLAGASVAAHQVAVVDARGERSGWLRGRGTRRAVLTMRCRGGAVRV